MGPPERPPKTMAKKPPVNRYKQSTVLGAQVKRDGGKRREPKASSGGGTGKCTRSTSEKKAEEGGPGGRKPGGGNPQPSSLGHGEGSILFPVGAHQVVILATQTQKEDRGEGTGDGGPFALGAEMGTPKLMGPPFCHEEFTEDIQPTTPEAQEVRGGKAQGRLTRLGATDPAGKSSTRESRHGRD
ncbi:hypothetical protein GWK47_038696 [Chionoecetes opilio]|uniref:Uncharacterized protein n=1 Tax=Chionoecetes opilio TaxID=41210 RepID=A0A8J4YRM4_CHIOP|nr:hypothetical protein GWK47_038696 [Chionoecetes opilio]